MPMSDGNVEVAADIYRKYVLPIVKGAERGDELLFVSPSTFFGFYSLGASTYEEVCAALRDAQRKGVRCRILIDVHDVLTATAAQGLMSFLRDGEELRDLHENRVRYSLMCYRQGGESIFVGFKSGRQKRLDFLPDVTVRPFGGVEQVGVQKLKGDDADARRDEFQDLWNMCRGRVEDSILRYKPWSYVRGRFEWLQLVMMLTFFAFGAVVGMGSVMFECKLPRSEWWVMLGNVVSGILVSVGATVATPWISRRIFRSN